MHDTSQARAWFKQMTDRHVTWLHTLSCEATPASTIYQPDGVTPLASSYIPNWGGYVNSHVPAGATSGMDWVVPGVNGSPSGSSAAVWIGQGGFNGNGLLAQTGSLSEPSGSGTTSYLWWELVPGYSIQKITNLRGNVNDSISVLMDTDVDRSVHFNLCNINTSQCVNIYKTASKAIGGSVEWVAERIDVGGYYTQLAKFGTVEITNPSSAYAGHVYTPGNSTAYDMRSCNGATLLASTGAYHTTPYQYFDETWKAYGSKEKAC